MTMQALHEAGGVEYLRRVAIKNPGVFMPFLARVLPLVVKLDDSSIEIVVEALRLNGTPVPGVLSSPIDAHVLKLVKPDIIDVEGVDHAQAD